MIPNKKVVFIVLSVIIIASTVFVLCRNTRELSEKDVLRIAQNELPDITAQSTRIYYEYELKKYDDNTWSVIVNTRAKNPEEGVKGGEFSMTIDGSTGEILSFWIFP